MTPDSFPHVPRRPLQSLIVLSLILFLGMPWMFLQTVAWVGMVVTYSQSVPLKTAVAKALGGKHPCAICKVVQKGQKKENEPASSRGVLKFEFLSAASGSVLYPPVLVGSESVPPVKLPFQFEAPPTPPPRLSHSSPV